MPAIANFQGSLKQPEYASERSAELLPKKPRPIFKSEWPQPGEGSRSAANIRLALNRAGIEDVYVIFEGMDGDKPKVRNYVDFGFDDGDAVPINRKELGDIALFVNFHYGLSINAEVVMQFFNVLDRERQRRDNGKVISLTRKPVGAVV